VAKAGIAAWQASFWFKSNKTISFGQSEPQLT
jgi:hypothetical protein